MAGNMQVTASQPPSRPLPKHQKTNEQRKNNLQTTAHHVIAADDDVRRLFEECSCARGNAQLLSEALTYARPEDLYSNDVIKVLHRLESQCN